MQPGIESGWAHFGCGRGTHIFSINDRSNIYFMGMGVAVLSSITNDS